MQISRGKQYIYNKSQNKLQIKYYGNSMEDDLKWLAKEEKASW